MSWNWESSATSCEVWNRFCPTWTPLSCCVQRSCLESTVSKACAISLSLRTAFSSSLHSVYTRGKNPQGWRDPCLLSLLCFLPQYIHNRKLCSTEKLVLIELSKPLPDQVKLNLVFNLSGLFQIPPATPSNFSLK